MNQLIVDDEKTILDGIRDGVDWSRLCFDEVLTAQSYEEAREILESKRIDLLLTDIEMDRYSGLDLVEWVESEKPETGCLILSCHDSFDFARRAVALHCLEYILKPVPYARLTEILEKAAESVRQEHRAAMLENYGKLYVKQLKEETAPRSEAADDLSVITDFIREHICESISVEELAALVHLSSRQLNRNFQKQLGMPVSDYIIHQRMLLAGELLKDPQVSVTMAADRSGYANYSYFTKQFRKFYGMSPREYQRTQAR